MPIQPFTNTYVTVDQMQVIVDILIHKCDLIEQSHTSQRVVKTTRMPYNEFHLSIIYEYCLEAEFIIAN